VILHQSFQGYLHCMWSLLWTAFAHPFQTTVIDWETGRVLSEDEAAAVMGKSQGNTISGK